LEASRFDAEGMKTLAHLMHPQGKVGQKEDLFDWTKILFHPDIRGLGATVESLNLLAKKMHAPFKFKATALVHEANRFFHSWFQSTHNVRIGIVEGGHRCETAMRIFYGYKIGQEVPLKQLEDFNPVDSNSTLVQPFSIKLVHPDTKHNLITTELIETIHKYSEDVQTQRNQVVQATYKQLWAQIYMDCAQVVTQEKYAEVFPLMTKETFIRLPLAKNAKVELVSEFIEDIKKAVIDRYWRMEPGKTEVKKLEKADFAKLVKRKKMLGRNFHGIREVSRSPFRGSHSSAMYSQVLRHKRLSIKAC
jgi:hypothetical protein